MSGSKPSTMSTVVSDNLAVAMAKTFSTKNKNIKIAIIKATTSKFHVVPKEKHVRTLKMAVSGSAPGPYVQKVITKLIERLRACKDWLSALKTLMVFHRLMRETDGTYFVQRLLEAGGSGGGGGGSYGAAAAQQMGMGGAATAMGNAGGGGYSGGGGGGFGNGGGFGGGSGSRGHLLNMDNFIDQSSTEGRFEYSEWVRAYGRYLDEQLEVFARIHYYQEAEEPGAESRLRNLPPAELLTQLPVMQRLMQRLMDCLPKGAAARDWVVQMALLTVAKESFQVYRAISEGVINLADCFFDMDYLDASKGLEIYRQSILDNERLSSFYAQAEQIDELKRSTQFPKLTPTSPEFLTMMEEYVKEAPRPTPEDGASGSKGTPLRKGKNAGKGGKDVPVGLPPPMDAGLDGALKVGEEPVPEPEPEAPPPPPPAVDAPDLLSFDDEEETTVIEPPEKTATELLAEEQAAAAENGGGAAPPGGPQFAPQPAGSNNPFGSNAFGGQGPAGAYAQQKQQPGPGAVVPYGVGMYGQPMYGQQPQYGYGFQQPGYGQQGYGMGGPVQPGALVPYGLNAGGYGGPPGYGMANGGANPFGAPSPSGSYGSFNSSPQPGGYSNHSPSPARSPSPAFAPSLAASQSFKNEAALHDPFAELGPIAPAATQVSPPLKEVSPTQQQKYNLGGRPGMLQIGPAYPYANGGGYHQQRPQQQQQQQPASGGFQGFSPQQAAHNGWAQQ